MIIFCYSKLTALLKFYAIMSYECQLFLCLLNRKSLSQIFHFWLADSYFRSLQLKLVVNYETYLVNEGVLLIHLHPWIQLLFLLFLIFEIAMSGDSSYVAFRLRTIFQICCWLICLLFHSLVFCIRQNLQLQLIKD